MAPEVFLSFVAAVCVFFCIGMKRRLFKLGLFVLAGTIINVAVAWVIELATPYPRYTRLSFPPEEAAALWQTFKPINSPLAGADRFSISIKQIDVLTAEADNSVTMSCISTGWPCLSMYGVYTIDNARRETSGGFWHITKTGYLPLRPVYCGFAVNTGFYASIMWLFFDSPRIARSMRRRRRIKRGLCPACAYPIGASDVCTECGKAVTR